jgi:hypothetical protein
LNTALALGRFCRPLPQITEMFGFLRTHVRVVPACRGYSMLGFVAPNDASKSAGNIFR